MRHLWLTSTPGIGGVIKQSPEDFVVIEQGGPIATGAGDHWLLRVRKRAATTAYAIKQLAAALGVQARDVGYAGLKDRHAVTEQQLTVPARHVTEGMLASVRIPDVEIIAAARHATKLRLGHLESNAFVITIRGVADIERAADHATAALAQLATLPGVPNWFGDQRFGVLDDNHAVALAMVRGEQPWPRDSRKARFLASALQAHWFNAWLAARIRDGLYATAIDGDWLKKRGGGQFTAQRDEVATETARLRAGELVLMGPMFGVEMRAAPPASSAAAREEALLREAGMAPELLLAMARHAPGTRRPASYQLGAVGCRVVAPDALEVRFHLPSGAYATEVLSEIQKPATTPHHEPTPA